MRALVVALPGRLVVVLVEFACAGGGGRGDRLGVGFGEGLGDLGLPPGSVATGKATPARTGISRAAASGWTV